MPHGSKSSHSPEPMPRRSFFRQLRFPMLSARYIKLLIATALLLGCRDPTRSEPISFLSLRPNELVIVRISDCVALCDHYTLFFESVGLGKVELSVFDRAFQKLPPISLSPSDLKSLDNAISSRRHFLMPVRSKETYTCSDSASVRIAVTKHAGWTILSEEIFEYEDCNFIRPQPDFYDYWRKARGQT